MSKQLNIFILFMLLSSWTIAQSPLPIKKDGKWGAISTEGKVIITPEYEFIGSFGEVSLETNQKAYWAYFRKDGKTGVLNGQGKVIIEPLYEQARIFPSAHVAVWEKGRVGLKDRANEWIIQPEYDFITPLKNSSLFKTAFKGKYGISDASGKVIHPCIFDQFKASNSSGICLVSQNGKFGALTASNGLLILPTEFDKVELGNYTAKGLKLKEIVEVSINKTGRVTDKQTYVNKTAYDLSKTKKANEEIKSILEENPDLNKPYWRKDGLRYKLVSPYGKKLIKQEFYAVGQEPTLGLSMGLLQTEEKKIECYLIDDVKGQILFKKEAKDMVLGDFLNAEYARITLDTLWDALVNREGEIIEKINGQEITNIGNFQNQRASVQLGGRYGFIDHKASLVIPTEYTVVSEFKDGYAIAKKNGKFGCIDTNGKAVIPFEHDGIALPDKGLIRLKKGTRSSGRWGLYTLDGKVILPQEYQLIDEFHDGEALIIKDRKYGLIDRKGNIIIAPSIAVSRVFPFKNGIAKVGNELMVENINGVPQRRYKSNGYIDKKGEFIIKPSYDYILNFDSIYQVGTGLAQIVKNNLVGFIDAKGREVVAPKYAGIQGFEDVWTAKQGLAKIVNTDGKFGYIDHRGKLVLNPAFSSVDNFEACLADTNVWAKASDNGKYGYINYKGETKISFIYDNVSNFVGDVAIVRKQGKYGLINKKNESVLPIQYDGIRFLENTNRKFVLVYQKTPSYYYFDQEGKVVKTELAQPEPKPAEGKKLDKYKYLTQFDKNGLAIISEDGLRGLANRDGKVIIKPKYRDLGTFSEGLAYFRSDNKDRKKRKYGFIDMNGKEVVAPIYSKASNFSDGKAAVLKGSWGYIDKNGKLVIPHKYRQAMPFSGGYAIVDNTGIIDHSGTRTGKITIEGKIISGFSSDRAVFETPTGILHIKPDGSPAYYNKYDEVGDFNGKVALVKRGEKWILTRQAGSTTTEVPFTRAAKNLYGKRRVIKTPFGAIKDLKWTLVENGVWRMIDSNGNLISDANFDQVVDVTTEGYLKVQKIGFLGIAGVDGTFVAKPQNESVSAINETLFKIEYQGKIGYLKSDGTWLWKLQ